MDVLDSSHAIFAEHYGRSRQSFADHSGRIGDRSRNSHGSYVTSMDLSSPENTFDFAFSDSSLSEPDMELMTSMNPFLIDTDSTSPMSHNLSEDFFTPAGSWNNHSPVSTQSYDIPTSRTISSGNIQVLQYPNSTRPTNQTTRHPPALFATPSFGNPGWTFHDRSNLTPEIRLQTSVSNEEPSPMSTQASMEPWSPVGQRYNGIPQSNDVLYGPATDTVYGDSYVTSYPVSVSASVMSLDSSSPQPPGMNTPSSTRSPSLLEARLHSTSPRTSDFSNISSRGYSQDQDQTPRPLQNNFNQAQYGSLTQNIAGLGGLSQQAQASKRKRNDCAQREPSKSPFSDFVVVESIPESAMNASRLDTKPNMTQTSTVFYHEQYPQAEEKKAKRTHDHTHQVRKPSNGRKSGGRPLGMHLDPEKAAKAKDLRADGACWICCLQRDSCTAGDICARCIKRNQRAQMEHGLGCDRTKLTELKPIFIPDILNKLHEPQALKAFVGEHIGRWSGSAIKLKFNLIFSLPPMDCEVYEFEPRTNELLQKIEYFPNSATGTREFVTTHSPPLGMVHIEDADRAKYDKYLNKIVDNHLEKFADRAFKFEKDDFQGRLLKLMVRLHPEQKDEAALLHDIFRLQVVTYLMGRAPAIPRSQHHVLYSLHYSKNKQISYSKNCSSRMVNRQLKFLFCALFNQIMESVLKRLQQILRSSRGGAKWTSAFCAILGLAMCFEEVQRTVHGNQDIEAKKGRITEFDAAQRAEESCRLIDDRFGFITRLFRWKYHRGFNPLRDLEDGKVQSTLGPDGVDFVRGIAGLVQEKNEFLNAQQFVAILRDNQDKYTSRLVARFLLSFWGPTIS